MCLCGLRAEVRCTFNTERNIRSCAPGMQHASQVSRHHLAYFCFAVKCDIVCCSISQLQWCQLDCVLLYNLCMYSGLRLKILILIARDLSGLTTLCPTLSSCSLDYRMNIRKFKNMALMVNSVVVKLALI